MTTFLEQTGTANPFDGIGVPSYSAPTLADLDGDGDLDLIVGEGDGFLSYYLNTGTAMAPVYEEQTLTDNPFDGIDVGIYAIAAFGDIDLDGDLDMVIGEYEGRLRYYVNNSVSLDNPAYSELTGTDNPFDLIDVGLYSTPTFVDLDADFFPDLVIGDSDGFLSYFRIVGPGGYVEQTGTNNPFDGINVGTSESKPAFGDVDGDGDFDLVVGEEKGALLYFLNDGSNTAPEFVQQTGTDNPFDGIVYEFYSAPTFGDVDGDGDVDLLVGEDGGLLHFLENQGSAPVNEPPVAVNDRFTVSEDTVSMFGNVLDANPDTADSDADGGLLTVVQVNGDSFTAVYSASLGNGILEMSDFGDFEFFTQGGYEALDETEQATETFTYTVDDGQGGSASATVTITIQGVNDAPDLAVAAINVNEGQKVTLSAADFTVTDPDDSSFTFSVFGVAGGFFQLSTADGVPIQTFTSAQLSANQVQFVDDGDEFAPEFSFSANDGTDTSSRTPDVVVYNPVNDAPVVDTATLTLNEGETVTLSAANFVVTDPDHVSFTFTVSDLTGGFFQLSTAAGTAVTTFTSGDLASSLVQFVDDGNESAPAFSFTVSDGQALSNTLAATINYTPVNDAPVVNAAALTLNEGQTVTLSAANFTVVDPDNSSFTFSVSGLAGGFFQLSTAAVTPVTTFTSAHLAGGLVQFVDDGNEVAPAFSITANDGALNSNTLAAAINYTPVNDAPVGVDDSAQTSLNTAVNIGVIANDTDVDGGALRVAAVTPGSNGSTAIRADGVSVRYTPSTGFSGFDSFSYTVSDGAGGTAVANVRVLVASVTGSNGNDVPLGTQQADFVLALDGNDRVLTHGGADYVDGGRGADTITGGDGADTLLGGEGADTFLATSAELAGDQIDGGEGTDTLVITNAPASIPANFSFMNLEQISYTGALLVAHGSLVDLSSLTLAPGSSNLISGGTANSRITGTASADNIVDSAGNDDLRGAAGNDTIYGGFGQDTIHGGTGNDALYGGSASAANDFVRDTFVFNTPLNATTNVDQIFGFQANSQDRIALDLGIFSAITGGASLGLDAGEFLSVNGGNAQDGNDFIIFDPTTGNLFYDADGNGPGAKVLFATLVGLNGTLDVTDFGVAESPF